MLRRLVTAMTESAAKRIKTTTTMSPSSSPSPADGPLIGTHSGHFHADEALAVHMLRMLPEYRRSPLVRTRDPSRLADCHTVVDVGGEYDAERRRFDHHQRGFAAVFPGHHTKLSSAGLVFMHFGRSIIAQRLSSGADSASASAQADDKAPEVDLLYRKIYADFIEALDAHDNGIAVYDPQAVAAAGLVKRYSEAGFGLGAIVGRLNPNWNDPVPEDPVEAQRVEDDKFLAASRRIGDEFERELEYCATAWLPARAVVQRAFDDRARHDPQGRVLVFEDHSAPWKDHLYSLEDGKPQVLYVLYREKPGPDAKWRIQCVPESKDSFVSRKPLPEAWRGFRDEELDKITGIPGCVFVHAAGFIGGNKTFDGVKEMVSQALAA